MATRTIASLKGASNDATKIPRKRTARNQSCEAGVRGPDFGRSPNGHHGVDADESQWVGKRLPDSHGNVRMPFASAAFGLPGTPGGRRGAGVFTQEGEVASSTNHRGLNC